jgi:hypothetical protein
MILRFLVFALAAVAALLSYEFFLSLLVAGSHFNMHTVLHVVLPGTAGIVLSAVAMWRLRQRRSTERAQPDAKRP